MLVPPCLHQNEPDLKKKKSKKEFFGVCSIPFGFVVVVWFGLFFVFQAIADAESLLQVPSHPSASE